METNITLNVTQIANLPFFNGKTVIAENEEVYAVIHENEESPPYIYYKDQYGEGRVPCQKIKLLSAFPNIELAINEIKKLEVGEIIVQVEGLFKFFLLK